MTSQEKTNYVNALNSLYTSGVINQYVADHRPPGGGGFSQHGNLNFLPWHRIYLYYFEKELRAVNPKIAIPYWDWTTSGDWSSSSPIFSNGSTPVGLFERSLNGTWQSSITRDIGASGTSQPTTGMLSSLVGTATFSTFAVNLESSPHGSAHLWVGGTMRNSDISPLDPVFYQNHGMVDKVFQDWTEAQWNGSAIAGLSTTLGSVTGKSAVNANSIIDSRAVKVWYAKNSSVIIDKYTVSNTTLGVSTGDEQYNYKETINFSTDATRTFTVPSGQVCRSISSTTILLQPGFLADGGSIFEASIDAAVFNTPKIGVVSFEPDNIEPEYDNSVSDQKREELLKVFPNPSSGTFDLFIVAGEDVTYSYVVYDAIGNTVEQKNDQKGRGAKLELSGHQPGIYMIKLQLNSGKLFTETLIIQ